MKLSKQKRRPSALELNMAAMIDVVFLLLIFFMCTSSFRFMEEQLNANVPTTQKGSGEEPKPEDFEPVRIELKPMEDGGVLMLCNDFACGTVEALENRLGEIYAVVPESVVILDGRGGVPFGKVVQAWDAALRVGFQQVRFAGSSAAL